MAIQSKKAKEIDVWIDSHKSCIKSKQKIEINGEIDFRDSYMLPINLLQYNHSNGRFNLEIREYEDKIERKLDTSDKEDVKMLKSLLLQDQSEAEKLKSDLEQLGEQREVAVITHDGIVVNGNRRMATIEELHIKHPSRWNELWVIRLPEDISEKDLWKIEAGLQLSKEKVADYGPVNNLLMIKEGKRAGLSEAEIAASMYGWTEKRVAIDLERLNLIDIFLQFFDQPNNYGLVKTFRLHEHFIDLQKGLVQKLKDSGESKKEIMKKLEIAFIFLRANIIKPELVNITHYDVRNICKILQDEKATEVLTESFDKHNDIKKIPVEKLIDNLDMASDAKKNREDQQKPVKLIDRAISALNEIDRKGNAFKDGEVTKKLEMLSLMVKTLLGIK